MGAYPRKTKVIGIAGEKLIAVELLEQNHGQWYAQLCVVVSQALT
jgi:hypothetical protein